MKTKEDILRIKEIKLRIICHRADINQEHNLKERLLKKSYGHYKERVLYLHRSIQRRKGCILKLKEELKRKEKEDVVRK